MHGPWQARFEGKRTTVPAGQRWRTPLIPGRGRWIPVCSRPAWSTRASPRTGLKTVLKNQKTKTNQPTNQQTNKQTKNWPKLTWGRKGLFHFTTSESKLITKGSQGKKECKTGSWRQEMKQKSWKKVDYRLNFQGLLSLSLYTTQDPLPKGSTIPRGSGIPTSITNKENAPLICLQTNLMEAFPQLRFPLPQWF